MEPTQAIEYINTRRKHMNLIQENTMKACGIDIVR